LNETPPADALGRIAKARRGPHPQHRQEPLERQGLLVRDADTSFLAFDPAAGGPMAELIGYTITYRVGG
jgi:hypothetical protein